MVVLCSKFGLLVVLCSKIWGANSSSGSLGDCCGEFTAVGAAVGAAVGGCESGNMARHSAGPLGRRGLCRLLNLCRGGVFLGDCCGEFTTEFTAVGAAVGGCESGKIARHSAGPRILGLLARFGPARPTRCWPCSGIDPPSGDGKTEGLVTCCTALPALLPVAPIETRLMGGTLIRTAFTRFWCCSSPPRGDLSGETIDREAECWDSSSSEAADARDGSLGGGNIGGLLDASLAKVLSEPGGCLGQCCSAASLASPATTCRVSRCSMGCCLDGKSVACGASSHSSDTKDGALDGIAVTGRPMSSSSKEKDGSLVGRRVRGSSESTPVGEGALCTALARGCQMSV